MSKSNKKYIPFGDVLVSKDDPKGRYIALHKDLVLLVDDERYESKYMYANKKTDTAYEIVLHGSNSVFGELMKSKDGTRFYIKVNNDIKLNMNGLAFTNKYINVQKPLDRLNFFFERGFVTEDEFETQSQSIPEYKKFVITAVQELSK